VKARKRTVDVESTTDSETAQIDYGFLWQRVGYVLLKIRAQSFRVFSDLFVGEGLAPGQFHILYLIARNPGLKQIAIGNAAGIDRSTMAPIVDRFEKMGWVQRTRRPDNRRAYSLELTRAGRDLLQKAMPLVDRHERELIGSLTKPEQREVLHLLTKMYQGIIVQDQDSTKPQAVRPDRPSWV
jgi:DNA-binding MarR family transcriptional regulator